MNQTIKLLSVLVVGVALVALGFLGYHTLTKSVDTPAGATAGADSNYPCETHNGIQTCFYNSPMNQASTTVCSAKSPTATSTLARPPFMSWTVGSTTAFQATIAKGASPNASTTLLSSVAVAAGAQGTVVASSTASGALLDNTNVIAPNTYINFSFSGGTGTFSPTGRCIAEFESVSPVNR